MFLVGYMFLILCEYVLYTLHIATISNICIKIPIVLFCGVLTTAIVVVGLLIGTVLLEMLEVKIKNGKKKQDNTI